VATTTAAATQPRPCGASPAKPTPSASPCDSNPSNSEADAWDAAHFRRETARIHPTNATTVSYFRVRLTTRRYRHARHHQQRSIGQQEAASAATVVDAASPCHLTNPPSISVVCGHAVVGRAVGADRDRHGCDDRRSDRKYRSAILRVAQCSSQCSPSGADWSIGSLTLRNVC